MKAIKVVFKIVVFLVALVVVALLALPLWFGPVVKTAANAMVPGVVKTGFRLDHLSLNPYTARFELGGLQLDNPTGYAESRAVAVGDIVFDAETLSLMTDVIHVEEITAKDLFVSVVSGGENKVLNFTQIQYNVSGGKEKHEAAQAEKEAKTQMETDKSAKPAAPKAESAKKQDKPAKKIVIDRLEISGLKLQLSILPIRVPSVVLTDIGRKSGGATLDEAWQQILDGIMKAAGVTSDQLKSLGISYDDAMKKANEALSKGTAQATAAMDGANKQLSATTEKTTAAMGDATKKLSETTGQATKAVDEGAKAVGDNAKKALESLKSLW